MQTWSLDSWVSFPYVPTIEYPDANSLHHTLNLLQRLPPLVTPDRIIQLKQSIACAGRGEAFLLQGGDCAESFQDCHLDIIHSKHKILQQMSFILFNCIQKEIIPIGRIAGQYAKARSSDVETRENITLKSYCGDLVHQSDFTAAARIPDPRRLLEGYICASKTLDILATLQHHSPSSSISPFLFTSHEALHLPYEQALTRYDENTQRWYLLSTHFPWVGVRTNQLNSAQVEFLRGIANPIGIKIGPQATPKWLLSLLNILNPQKEEGRILLITRLGAHQVHQKLSPLIQTLQTENIPVTWSCDPMHGNTQITQNGFKTRHFNDILLELKETLFVHQHHRSHLGGVHLELTGESVTECIGGSRGIKEADLHHAYHSLVDPRLNYEQSLEIAMQLGSEMRQLKN